ncbi:WXG100 family type VII secretion target [Nocardioides campestrisoli]|uniref:WXG100 family type VII secretion target n=1 Tax=Nocardioides campestrisoli TaxID=2736757 RepID=UPI00163DE2A8|nr:WXG100 family type VII secretion target [Nocardioides campestrisoli]
MTAYRVDLEELRLVVDEMAAFHTELAELAADVSAQTRRLHEGWAGLARDAHAGSHARWQDELADMRQALQGIRALGAMAQANYGSAVEANLTMWQRVR